MTREARYEVTHETWIQYAEPVAFSSQMVRLAPRPLAWQAVEEAALDIDPAPDTRADRVDAFGNPTTLFCIERSHRSLLVRATQRTRVFERRGVAEGAGMSWEAARERLAFRAGRTVLAEDFEASRFLFESARVRNKRELARWAAPCFGAGESLLTCARRLSDRIHEEIAFDPTATTVSTPVTEVLAKKRGVCQDFAHLFLSCLRSLGLAARYVSGYLLTHPPPGRPRLVGADASHAWVSVYCPDLGWIDLDPTNAMLAETEHITIGWGRDFDDVSPLRGVILGGGAHQLSVAVTVSPTAI